MTGTRNKTGGGRGTNQHMVRGRAKAKAENAKFKVLPRLMDQAEHCTFVVETRQPPRTVPPCSKPPPPTPEQLELLHHPPKGIQKFLKRKQVQEARDTYNHAVHWHREQAAWVRAGIDATIEADPYYEHGSAQNELKHWMLSAGAGEYIEDPDWLPDWASDDPNLSPEALQRLSRGSREARLNVAKNRNTPVETLIELAQDERYPADEEVRKAAKANPSFPK